ncbi:MAG: Gfo/Idh/MocA family oxidoreductase, partial [Betaproteobacteria bacterium]
MNLHARLLERERNGHPLRVGLIGAGKFASMYLAQLPRTPGVRLTALADLDPARARAALERVGWSGAQIGAVSFFDD